MEACSLWLLLGLIIVPYSLMLGIMVCLAEKEDARSLQETKRGMKLNMPSRIVQATMITRSD